MPFESEVEPTLPPEAETPTVATMAVAAAAASQQDREEDETLDHVLRQSTANPHASINNNLIRNVNLLRGNIEESDISQLRSLGLEVENEDPLPENFANVGTMHRAAKAVGNWTNPILCPRVQENCRNSNGRFTTMSWEIIAEADELEIFKVRIF